MSDSPNSTDSFLRSIGRYDIQERIGTGGMARVYRAKDTALEREVAIKILHEHLADDALFRARFEREAKFVASFNHPNIIQIYDYATIERETQYLCYMVMTYLKGKNLKQVMDDYVEQNTLMPPAQTLQIIQDISAALDYAHQLGMIHRDVKPANILFDANGRAILTDFGIARLAESSKLTQENVAVGTPAYMSPEQAAGEQVDNRTDIYALGVILYEMLAGKPPFGDDGSISVLLKHLNEPVPPLTQFEHIRNPQLDHVIFCALAKDPNDRYQSASELAQDLARALNNEPTQAATLPPPQRTTQIFAKPTTSAPAAPMSSPPRRSAMGILVVGMLIILLMIASATFVMNQRNNAALSAQIPTLEIPLLPSPTSTPDPADFRRFGGFDSMVQEEDLPSMTAADNMGFSTWFDADDMTAAEYWMQNNESTEDGSRQILRTIDTENGVYRFENQINNRAAISVVRDFYYTQDINIMADVTLTADSPTSSGYGIVFHRMNENNFGVFAIDGAGRYSIWFLENGTWRELRNLPETWTRHPAILPAGENNTLRLHIRGDMLQGFVNDVEVVALEDGSIGEGGVGVYLAMPNRTESFATALFDNYAVQVIAGDTVPSMTGE